MSVGSIHAVIGLDSSTPDWNRNVTILPTALDDGWENVVIS